MKKLEKLDPRIKMLITAACIAALHTVLLAIFGIYKYLGETVLSSTYLLVITTVLLVFEIAVVIAARIKRYKIFLKGLFLYKLIGVIFFVIAWGVSLKQTDTSTGFFALAFSWFSISTQPVATLISPLVHLSVFFRRGIIFAIMTYLSGAMVSSIKNEENFERKMAEKNN